MPSYITSPTVTLAQNDVHLACNAVSNSIVVTLERSSKYIGEYTISKNDISQNTVTITPAVGETIDGQSSITLYLKAQYRTITPIPGGWTIVDMSYTEQYIDYNVPLIIGKPTAGGKPDYDYTNCGYLFPQNDASEILVVRAQMPHGWKQGSAIYPHVHWRQKANAAAVFKIDYKWYNNGDAEPSEWTTLPLDTYSYTYTSGTLGQISYSEPIDGTGKTISSILLIKLYREDNTYTGDALVDDFDIHLLMDSVGSNYEYVK